MLGSQICTVTSASGTQLACTVPGLSVGPQIVIVNLSGQ